MSLLEQIAVLLGLANIVLLVRRSVWNYPFGLAMVALYAPFFFFHRLYSDALLQLFFFAVNLWGWWLWTRSRAEEGAIMVRRMSARLIAAWSGGTALAILLWGAAEARLTDADYPWLDAPVAIVSVVAQVLLAKRYLENWILWILVDLLSLWLYWLKDLPLTMALYALFLILAAWGLVEWSRTRAAQGTRG
ncbi:MAG: nicotinamide riboside transporter PnuC [Sphingomonadales bacterium]|nr:MAG: nicotinamide riboside transporter PnuC [Sphingomonadales bacterium]